MQGVEWLHGKVDVIPHVNIFSLYLVFLWKITIRIGTILVIQKVNGPENLF